MIFNRSYKTSLIITFTQIFWNVARIALYFKFFSDWDSNLVNIIHVTKCCDATLTSSTGVFPKAGLAIRRVKDRSMRALSFIGYFRVYSNSNSTSCRWYKFPVLLNWQITLHAHNSIRYVSTCYVNKWRQGYNIKINNPLRTYIITLRNVFSTLLFLPGIAKLIF